MKIIISMQEPNLEGKLDRRFGRAQFFISVDSETMEWEPHSNPAIEQAHGAGITSAQWVCEQGAEAVISGDFGPNAARVLQAANIALYKFNSEQTGKDALMSFNNEELQRF